MVQTDNDYVKHTTPANGRLSKTYTRGGSKNF